MALQSSPLVAAAERTARRILKDDRQRTAHVEGAARAAAHVARDCDPGIAASVVAAAWLHDIGYAQPLVRTGFHPLDGALHLAGQGWPDDVVRLVAHHSHAAMLAAYYGVTDHLTVLDPVPGPAPDLLTFADLVSGVDGSGTTIRARIQQMRERHASGLSIVPAEVREQRYRRLEQTGLRVLRSNRISRVSLVSA